MQSSLEAKNAQSKRKIAEMKHCIYLCLCARPVKLVTNSATIDIYVGNDTTFLFQLRLDDLPQFTEALGRVSKLISDFFLILAYLSCLVMMIIHTVLL